MNIFTDLLFVFIFLYTIFYFEILDISNDSYILHKFILFILLFGFYFIVQVIRNLKTKCYSDIYQIINKSMYIAITGIIGYAIYTDFLHMESTKEYFTNIIADDRIKYLVVSFIIVLSISIIKILELLFTMKSDECKKTTQLTV